MANPFLVADDLANGSLRVVRPSDAECASVELGAYIFSARESSLKRASIRKFRSWIALRAADFLAAYDLGRIG
jgi:hypothetical protein